MINVWVSAAATVPVVVSVLRELVALARYRVRPASVERVLHDLGPGSRVVDREPDGAVIEVTIAGGSGAGSDRQRDEPTS
jgi:hypothetical protein